jgi:hypothetical protein
MCRRLRCVSPMIAFLAAACIDNGGPSAPATSTVNIQVPNEPQPLTGFQVGADPPLPSGTTPSDPSPAQGGVTVIPPTGSNVTTLTNGALLVIGDTLTLVGNEMAALGGVLPPGVGSIVTLVSSVPTQAGAALKNSNRGLDATLHGVLSASLNPLQSSNTLLAPAASGTGRRPALLADGVALVSPRLQQALADGLTGAAAGAANQFAALTPLLANGAPTTLLAPALAGTGSTVGAAMPVTGVPLTGMTTTGATMTGAAMTGASMTATSAMAAPTITSAPTVTATTAPITQTLRGVGTTVGTTTSTLTGTVNGLLGKR